MVTLQTYIVYIVLFIMMLFLSILASERKESTLLTVAIFVYSIIFGMRYGVGVDHLSYLTEYLHISYGHEITFDDTEIGYRYIRNSLAKIGFHYTIFFALIAFIQLWLVFKTVKKNPTIYPYLVATFFLGCIWLTYSNGLRQQLAFCIFAYSLLYINNKKQLPIHYLLLLLAYSMHTSALILVVVAPLLLVKKDWFSNVKIQSTILLVAIIIGKLPQMETWLFSLEGNLGIFESLMEESGYNEYFGYDDGDRIFKDSGQGGLGYYISLLINFIIIWYSSKVKKYNENNEIVTYIYNLGYIGIVLYYLFINSAMIGRINYYFYGFVYIFGAYTLHYLYHKNKKTFVLLIVLYGLTFIAHMYRMYDNTAAFYFFWQQDLYLLNK